MKQPTAGRGFVQAQIGHSISGLEFTGVLTARIREASKWLCSLQKYKIQNTYLQPLLPVFNMSGREGET